MTIQSEDFIKFISKDYGTWEMIGNATYEKDELTKDRLRLTHKANVKYNEPSSMMDKKQMNINARVSKE